MHLHLIGQRSTEFIPHRHGKLECGSRGVRADKRAAVKEAERSKHGISLLIQGKSESSWESSLQEGKNSQTIK